MLQNNIENALRNQIESANLDPWDVAHHNIGITFEGRPIVFDAGAVGQPFGDYGLDPRFAEKPTFEIPGKVAGQEVRKAGGPRRVRQSLAEGLRLGTKGYGGEATPEVVAYNQMMDFLRARGML